MDQHPPTQRQADSINEQMVRQMELRRAARPERRRRAKPGAPATSERRRICAFCYQPGDHQTPTQCLRALER